MSHAVSRAADRIGAAKHLLQAGTDGHEQLVPHVVPEAVVDQLEVVEVHEEGRDGAAVAIDGGERVPQPVEQERPVGQAGQGIMHGLMGKLLLRPPALGHVVHRHDGAERSAVLALDRPAVAQHYPWRTVPWRYHQLGVADALPSQRAEQRDILDPHRSPPVWPEEVVATGPILGGKRFARHPVHLARRPVEQRQSSIRATRHDARIDALEDGVEELTLPLPIKLRTASLADVVPRHDGSSATR